MPTELRAGLAMLALMLLAGIAGPWLAPHDPLAQTDPVAARHLPPGTVRYAVVDGDEQLLVESASPNAEGMTVVRLGETRQLSRRALDTPPRKHRFLLGSDHFGRDVLSRLLYGARITFFITFVAGFLSFTLGIAVGTLAARGGKVIDAVVMRAVDGLLAFPWIFLVMTIGAFFQAENNATALAVVIGASSWMGVSRLVRSEILRLDQETFVLAARATGAHPVRVFFRHLLPHTLTPLTVQVSLAIGGIVAVEAALSYLGIGIHVPTPTWGNMIKDGQPFLLNAWWVSLFPAMALTMTVLALALISDGVRDALDPHSDPA